jgi:decaprenylphospho-beta-D-erythro-pentofuranosid-2-ulose 2-reductase
VTGAGTATERGTVVVLGATSGIARATAAALARRGYGLYLAGRDADEVERVATDLALRHRVPVRHGHLDALAVQTHGAFVRRLADETQPPLVGAVVAFGTLGDEDAAHADFAAADPILRVNLLGAVSVLTHFANALEARGSGFLVGISSVAGDRGRRGNYCYGAAKAGLTAFLSGLRARLRSKGVRVITVKPGFVDTAMTFGRPGMFLVASPAEVGERIARAIERGTPVLYVPWFWRWIMLAIRAVPERLFMRLDL